MRWFGSIERDWSPPRTHRRLRPFASPGTVCETLYPMLMHAVFPASVRCCPLDTAFAAHQRQKTNLVLTSGVPEIVCIIPHRRAPWVACLQNMMTTSYSPSPPFGFETGVFSGSYFLFLFLFLSFSSISLFAFRYSVPYIFRTRRAFWQGEASRRVVEAVWLNIFPTIAAAAIAPATAATAAAATESSSCNNNNNNNNNNNLTLRRLCAVA